MVVKFGYADLKGGQMFFEYCMYFFCVLLAGVWFYQSLKLSLSPRIDNADVYRSPIGPIVMGVIFALSAWISMVCIPFWALGMDVGTIAPMLSWFLVLSEITMVFFYWKPLVNWIRKINGLPVGVFYEYPQWWA